uniref:Potassium/proton antiporter CemA n=1 Tax=Schizaea elegans TaxID=180990 RepID=A0A286QH98_9MONI|nr:envelope membrane protein [Schizaea elegans]APT65982.1 envelope membrane protein [Schizaea elegans]
MKIDCWRLIRWFCETPHRSSDRAHEVSKKIQLAKKKYLYHARMESAPGKLSEAAPNGGFDLQSIIIYWSLLEHRISIVIPSISNKLTLFHRSQLSLLTSRYRTAGGTNVSPSNKNIDEEEKSNPGIFKPHYLEVEISQSKSRCHGYKNGVDNRINHIQSRIDESTAVDDSGTYTLRRHMCMNSKKYEQMNRKLVWIEAVLNDSVVIGKCAEASPPLLATKNSNDIMAHELKNLLVSASAYELTNLIPRSINRTLSKFGTELTNQSTPLVLHDFRLAKHQASASLKTIGCLIIFSFLIHAILKNEFAEPWIGQLRNTSELQIFLNPFQEEMASNQFRRTEGLLWLDGMIGGSVGLRLQGCDAKTCDQNIQSVILYNKLNTQIVSRVVSDAISLATPILLLAVSRRRLAVLNPWIRELFHSSNDTIKAFSILLITDLCVGFHSPQGWEIITGCFSEHVGFARDRYMISCFVSTFPVILDTVFKYWIFRHLNRASPSIVATYHTTNE